MNWKQCERKQLWPSLTQDFGICFTGPRKAKNIGPAAGPVSEMRLSPETTLA